MKVTDVLQKGEGSVVTVEIEPLKIGENIETLWKKLDNYVATGISWIDITVHAQRIVGWEPYNGSAHPIYQVYKSGTDMIAALIKQRYITQNVFPVPHVICSGVNRYETAAYLQSLIFSGIDNLLAVRGDGIKEFKDGRWIQHPFKAVPYGHDSSYNLMRQIRDLQRGIHIGAEQGAAHDFCIGGGGYPDGYWSDNSDVPEAIETQIARLKQKYDEGLLDYIVTQMFFRNDDFLRFRDQLTREGVDVPVIPGLMPLYKKGNINALQTHAFNCYIPPDLIGKIISSDNETVRDVGVEHCLNQIAGLRKEGVPSFHIYAARGAPVQKVLEHIPFEFYNLRKKEVEQPIS